MMENKYIILLSVRLEEDELKFIRENGYKIILLKNYPTKQDHITHDMVYPVNLNNLDNLFEIMDNITKSFYIERIIAFNDEYLYLCAEIAKRYNILYFGHDEVISKNFTNKSIQKDLFTRGKIPCGKSMTVKSKTEAISVLHNFDYPLVIKPINAAGGYQVHICNNKKDFDCYIDLIFNDNKNHAGQNLDGVLIEEYLDGFQYSVETVTIDGIHTIINITENEIINIAEVKHTVPAMIDNNVTEDIKRITNNALNQLGIKFGVTHSQFRLTRNGPKVIEINGRVSGGGVPEIVEYVYGVDLRKTALNIALKGSDSKIVNCPKIALSATAQLIYSYKSGILKKINIPEEIENNKNIKRIRILIQSNDKINSIKCNLDRFGIIYIISNSKQNSSIIADEIFKKISIEIK